jgi:hypothetical protein
MSLKSKKIIVVVTIVVLSIVGWKFFSSYISISYNAAAYRARDVKRVEDFQNFRMALMIYYTEHNVYPNGLTDLMPRYLSEIPFDPREGELHKSSLCESVIKENTFSYRYELAESGEKFTITTCLEKGKILTISSNENE